MRLISILRRGETGLTLSSPTPALLPLPSPSASPGEAPPSTRWHLLFPLGKTKYRADFVDGISFTRATLAAMARNFETAKTNYLGKDGGFGIPVTFTHVGGSGPSNFRAVEDRRAAGWIEALELRDDGLWALTRWTEEGRRRIQADEFRFLSPEFALEYMNADTGESQGATLFGASLVNDPFLTELPRVAASRSTKGVVVAMDKAKLCLLLGLTAEASDEDVEKALKAKLEAAPKPDAAAGAADTDSEDSRPPPPPPPAEVAAVAAARDVETLKLSLANTAAQNATLAKELAAAQAKLKASEEAEAKAKRESVETEAKAFCAALVQAGRLVPAKIPKLVAFAAQHGLSQLEELYDVQKPVVDLKERGVTSSAPVSNDAARLAFNAEVDKLIAAGREPLAATRAVRTSHPELAKQVFG